MAAQNTPDTIAAIATPAGNGGIGIVRISGPLAVPIANQLTSKPLVPRHALFTTFKAADGCVIDAGILLYFPAPHSYTGEDTVELQAHGGAVVLDMLLTRVIRLGARLANPGEFTQTAFCNNKLDLAQAEAVADLIESSTEQSARSAQRSMQGVFSQQINLCVEQLTELRVQIEAAIDFTDEAIDFLADGAIKHKIDALAQKIQQIQTTARQGSVLREGLQIVLAGKPNAGKSSLLNALAGHEAAIVTDLAGTTRDLLKEQIQIDGMPLHIIDTAGLKVSENSAEKEGIRRAQQAIGQADKVLLVIDSTDTQPDAISKTLPAGVEVTKIYNKIDLLGMPAKIVKSNQQSQIHLSAKTRAGIDLLSNHLKQSAGFSDHQEDTLFIARRRHIEALNVAQSAIACAQQQLQNQALELVAEELKHAQNSLAEITGTVSSDDLLGKIFSSFCIGK